MKTAIILHGQPSKEGYYNPNREAESNSHWLRWIQKQLLVNDYLAQALELPQPYYPDYETWKTLFERFDIDENTILIGHSRGGAFLIRWLSENKTKTDKVALVAPSMFPVEKKKVKEGFFDFKIDPKFPSRTKGVTVFHSTDDASSTIKTIAHLKEKINGIEYKEFTDKGHFTFKDLNTQEFPELRDILLG